MKEILKLLSASGWEELFVYSQSMLFKKEGKDVVYELYVRKKQGYIVEYSTFIGGYGKTENYVFSTVKEFKTTLRTKINRGVG